MLFNSWLGDVMSLRGSGVTSGGGPTALRKREAKMTLKLTHFDLYKGLMKSSVPECEVISMLRGNSLSYSTSRVF